MVLVEDVRYRMRGGGAVMEAVGTALIKIHISLDLPCALSLRAIYSRDGRIVCATDNKRSFTLHD